MAPAIAFGVACTLVLGCGLIKKKKPPTDDDEPLANAPTVQAGGTGAKNEKDVLRYKNEVPLFDEPAVIAKDGVRARTFPGTGADVSAVPRGTTVLKKAKLFSTGVLVLFDDPASGNGTKLLGWITPDSLVGGPAIPVAPILTGPKPVTTATATARDAGLAAVDAGKPVAVVDAGGGGGAVPAAPAALLQVLPNRGTCPAGFTLVGVFCRRPCTADGNCPANSFCTLGSGARKTCAATR